jgi:hypothetical protein
MLLTGSIYDGTYDNPDELAAEALYYIIRGSHTKDNTVKLGDSMENWKAGALGDQTANFFESVGSYFDPNTGTVRLAT